MKRLQELIRKLFEGSLNIHIVFISLFLITFCLPSLILGLPEMKLFRVFLYGFFLLMNIYVGRWCCRKWLLRNQFLKFIVFSSIMILALIIIGLLGSFLLTHNNILAILLTVSFAVLLFFSLGSFFSITRTSILRQLNETFILKEQKDSELRLLKSQLSPHFLFNVLNNLYGLSLKQDEKLPQMILKLSGLLRYSIYDTGNHFVPLRSEIESIENYIELEKMRMGSRLQLKSNLQKEMIDDILISPMILMVFIENAFKHSSDTNHKNVDIKIGFRVIDKKVELRVKNKVSPNKKTINSNIPSTGMGLSITKKRLELLYSKKHSLEIKDCPNFYEIDLKIDTK